MAVLAGCSQDTTVIVSDAVVPPVVPDAPVLTTPEEAVRSYTDWISYAYRILDSEIATHAFSPFEEVNVNSYVQYNLMENRAIEQALADASYKRVRSNEGTVTLVGQEFWRYRYIDPQRQRYLTPPMEASYDITYTVVRQPDGRWLVDKVLAERRDEPEKQ